MSEKIPMKEHNTGGIVFGNVAKAYVTRAGTGTDTLDADTLVWFGEIEMRLKLASARKVQYKQKEQDREQEWERLMKE